MKQQDFVDYYGPLARDVAAKTGLDASLVLGQIAQETGWGDHIQGNNIFAIRPNGEYAKYADVPSAAQAYVNLINGPHYRHVAGAGSSDQQAATMAAAGYSERPDYGIQISKTAKMVRDGGYGAPSADEIIKRLDADQAGQAQAPAAQPAGAPSADEIIKTIEADHPAPASTPAPTPASPEATASGLVEKPGYSQAGTITPQNDMIPSPHDPLKPMSSDYVSPIAAAKAGYNDTSILTPQAQQYVDQNLPAPVSGVINRLTGTIGGALGVANGAYRGVQAGVADVGNALSPGLGSDAATMMDIAPVALSGTGAFARAGLKNAASARQAAAEAKILSPEFRANPMAEGVRPEAVSPGGDTSFNPNVEPPSGGGGGGGGGAAGADYTRGPIPQYTAAQLATVEKKMLYQTAADRTENGRDTSAYLPGETPSFASVEPLKMVKVGDRMMPAALAEKTLIATDPEFRLAHDAQTQHNNAIRLDHYNDLAGDPNTIQAAVDARKAQLDTDRAAVFAQAKPVDAQPVVAAIDQILQGPDRQRVAVRNALNKVADSLHDPEGNLLTDPEMLAGARNNINDMLSKSGQQAAPDVRLATRQLTAVKELLTNQIESAAPGYRQYLQNYADASKPIDAMRYLQSKLPGLTDNNGMMQYGKVQNMLKDAINQRHDLPGVQDAKSLSPEQMQGLELLRNSLARDALKDSYTRVKGSDTTQQLNAGGMLGSLGRGAYEAALHAGAYLITDSGFGNFALSQTRNYLRRNADKKAANKLIQDRNALRDTLSGQHPDMQQ